MPAFKAHTTPTVNIHWDGPENKTRVRRGETRAYYGDIYAWYDPEGHEGAKETYKFIHHEVGGDGEPGAANNRGCSAGIGVLNGGRGGTDIQAADKKPVYDHLAHHLEDAEKEVPPYEGGY